MNRFEINIVDSVSEGGIHFKEVRLLIDGQDLVSLLKHFEKPFEKREGFPEIAGAYAGLSAAHTLRERFLGLCDLDYGDLEDKVAVLDCECGCEGCWPFAVKIRATDSSVRWSDFEQPHRTDNSFLLRKVRAQNSRCRACIKGTHPYPYGVTNFPNAK